MCLNHSTNASTGHSLKCLGQVHVIWACRKEKTLLFLHKSIVLHRQSGSTRAVFQRRNRFTNQVQSVLTYSRKFQKKNRILSHWTSDMACDILAFIWSASVVTSFRYIQIDIPFLRNYDVSTFFNQNTLRTKLSNEYHNQNLAPGGCNHLWRYLRKCRAPPYGGRLAKRTPFLSFFFPVKCYFQLRKNAMAVYHDVHHCLFRCQSHQSRSAAFFRCVPKHCVEKSYTHDARTKKHWAELQRHVHFRIRRICQKMAMEKERVSLTTWNTR